MSRRVNRILTPDEVATIRKLLEEREQYSWIARAKLRLSIPALAKRFDVSISVIEGIRNGTAYNGEPPKGYKLIHRTRHPELDKRNGNGRSMVCEKCGKNYRVTSIPMTGVTIETCGCGTTPLGRVA